MRSSSIYYGPAVCRKHDWFSRVRRSDCSGCRAGRGRRALEWRGGKGDLLVAA